MIDKKLCWHVVQITGDPDDPYSSGEDTSSCLTGECRALRGGEVLAHFRLRELLARALPDDSRAGGVTALAVRTWSEWFGTNGPEILY